MARQSSIDRLPREVRDLIRDLRQSGWTIDEILDKLRELDLDDEVSRSALGRHTLQIDRLTETLRASRGIAETVMERLEDSDDGRVARLNIELMHSILTKAMLAEDGSVADFDPKELMFLSSTLQKLSAAAKTDQDREIRLRAEIARETAAKAQRAADSAAKMASERGMSAELVDSIKREILGIAQ